MPNEAAATNALLYGLDGGEISSHDWSRLYRMKKRFVESDKVFGFEVDTIWEGRGVRIQFDPDGAPLIYQTVVYVGGTRVEIGHWWWKNRTDAVSGHNRIVEALRSGDYGPDSTELEKVIG